MHEIVQRLIRIQDQIKEENNKLQESSDTEIIAISKTFSLDTIMPLIKHGHLHFGENKIQEAKIKWTDIKKNKPDLNLHFVGKLQTNKAKDAVQLFDFIHSLESIKQAEALVKYENKFKKKLKYFVQINIGGETQKSGIDLKDVKNFLETCKNNYDLNIIGLMCLPPDSQFPEKYFKKMLDLKTALLTSYQHQVNELSIGMSNDYIKAIQCRSTFLRIGTKIFGERN